MSGGLAKANLDYAVTVGAPFWFDGEWCVYVIDGEYGHCVVAGEFRKVMYAGGWKHYDFADTGFARNVSLHAVAHGGQCVATSFGCVIYGGGCAVIVKGDVVCVIGRQTRSIRWDGTIPGRDRILDVLNDLGVYDGEH